MTVKRLSLLCLTQCQILTPADTTTTTTVSECPKCGTIGKSGKTSCCARGGSWFKSCGGAGNARLQHTWYEGIKACKARRQSRIAIGQRGHAAAQQKSNHSSNDADMVNSKAVITAATTFTLTSVNTSTPTSGTTPAIESARASASAVTSTTKPTRAPMHTPTVMVVPVHTSASTSTGYGNGAINSRAIATATNAATSASSRTAMANTSDSAPITPQGSAKLLRIVSYVGILIIMIR